MATIAGNDFSSPKAVNLRNGILRFDVSKTSNPLANDSNGWGLYINSSNQLVYWNKTSAAVVSGTSTAGSLDSGYDLGQTITVDNGAIVFNDASTGAANVLEFNKTGTGSGNILDFDFTAAFTGNALNLDMGSAVAAVGIVIDSEAGARTGTDLLFTDDSTGASHKAIVVNKSGAGTGGIAFEYVGSYTGSPAGQVFNIDLNANDNLDTEVMQLATGAGDRAIMFDFNLDHTDASTTSHVFDIDMGGVFDSNVIDIAYGAASTGNTIFVNLDNAVATTALHIEGSGARTQPMIEVTTDSTGSAQVFDLDIAGAGSGNFIDVLVGAVTYTGNVLDIDLGATGTGSQAIVLTSGVMTRTTALIEIADSGTPSGATMLVSISGASTGPIFDFDISAITTAHVLDITYSAASTGNAINVVMADNVAGAALNITAAGIRTDNLIEVTTSETGSVDGIMRMDASGVFTGSVVTLTSSGAATTGSLLHLDLDAGVAYKAITIDHAGARTAASVLVTFDGTVGAAAGGTFLDANITMTGASANPFFDIDITGVYTGNVFDVLIGSSAATGDVISINLGATATASQAMVVASGAMLRSTALFGISDAGTSSGATFDIDITGITTGIMFDIDLTAAATGAIFDFATNSASTGTIFEINMTNAVGAKLATYTLAGTRTADAITITDSQAGAVDVFQITSTSTSSGHVFNIDVDSVFTGNVFDVVFGTSAATGHVLHANMGTNLAGNAILIDAAGARTAPLIYIANTGTDAGTDDHVLYIYQTGILDSNLIQLEYATNASTGDALAITMAVNLAGSAVVVSAAGARTDDLIKIDDTGTGSGHIFDINLSGIYTGNVLDIAFATAAATGEAISIAMGTNVAGRALYISSAGTGVTDEGNAIDIAHTGILVAGADVVSIVATGAISSTSNALYVATIGDAGAYAVKINATGSAEALHVDAGTVLFDETLTVTGATTLSSTLSYRNLSEAVTTANVITAAESGTVFFLDAAGGFTSTLPAPAAGLNFTFIVKTAPTTAYVIATNAGANVLYGKVVERAGGAGVAGAAQDTVNFVAAQAIIGDRYDFVSDGTNWHMKGIVDVAAACTFAVT